jgi:hypothetical protein
MDKDTKFALLVIGLPILGLTYCGVIFAVLMNSVWARSHPILMAGIFALAPSLVSGYIWLQSAQKGQGKREV